MLNDMSHNLTRYYLSFAHGDVHQSTLEHSFMLTLQQHTTQHNDSAVIFFYCYLKTMEILELMMIYTAL